MNVDLQVWAHVAIKRILLIPDGIKKGGAYFVGIPSNVWLKSWISRYRCIT